MSRVAVPDGPAEAPSRRSTVGNGYIGSLQRAASFRLAKGLEAPGAVPVADACRQICDEIARQAAAGGISVRTAPQYIANIREITEFAASQGAETLADVDEGLAADYVFSTNAPRTRRAGQVPRLDTARKRCSAVRALFRTARLLGLDDRDPTLGIVLPARTAKTQRPIDKDPDMRGPEGRPATGDEVRRCRTASRYRHDDSRLPAACALATSGAGTDEMHRVLVDHLDLDAARTWCPGAGRSHGRWLPLDQWAVEALADHRLYLARRIPDGALASTPVVHVGPQRSRRRPGQNRDAGHLGQSEMSGLCKRLLFKAGLADEPGLRPMSLAEYAAVREFERTGRIERAAIVMGLASLDAAAAIVRYPWRAAHETAPPYEGAAP